MTAVVRREMIEHCLNCYGKRFMENGTQTHLPTLNTCFYINLYKYHFTVLTVCLHLCIDKVFYALHEDKVCLGVALMLLQNAVKFNLREFQEVWQQSVPEGMSTRLDQLKVSCHFSYIRLCNRYCYRTPRSQDLHKNHQMLSLIMWSLFLSLQVCILFCLT